MLGVRPGAVFSEIWCCILKNRIEELVVTQFQCSELLICAQKARFNRSLLLLCLQTQTSRAPQIPAAFVQHTEQKKAFICSALERRTASDVSGMCGKSPALILF